MKEDWIEVILGEVSEIISGKSQKDVISIDGEFPIYGTGGILGRATSFLCEAGTTIIGRKGTINSPIFVSEKFWNIDTAFGISPLPLIHKKFVYYFCLGFNFSKLDRSTTIPSLAKTDIVKIHFPLAPLPIQRAIVRKIENLFASLDKGIADLKTAREQLKIYRQAVLKKAFEGGFIQKNLKKGELPKGWKKITLGELLSISSGTGLPKNKRNDQGEYSVYGGNGIAGRHNEYIYDKEKLIIGRVGIFCGNVHITKPRSWITDNAFVVSFDETKFNIHFLHYLLRNSNLNRYASSTAQSVISQSKVYPIVVLIPNSIQEQIHIVREIESRLSVCDKVEQSINEALEKAEALRQSILKRAFDGKLLNEAEIAKCKQEADYEPASVLLERIKKEKQK